MGISAILFALLICAIAVVAFGLYRRNRMFIVSGAVASISVIVVAVMIAMSTTTM